MVPGDVNSIAITMLLISDITAAASDLTANNVTGDSIRIVLGSPSSLSAEADSVKPLTEEKVKGPKIK